MQVRWLGINGFEFKQSNTTILLDPYVTRNRKKVCDPARVAKYVREADYIVIGHSHWDHLADTAEIAVRTGAIVIGSRTTCNICRAQGVPGGQLREFSPGQILDFEGFSVEAVPSLHMQPMGYPGFYDSPPAKLVTVADFLEGGTVAPRLRFEDLSILNLGSANYIADALAGIECDYLLMGISGRAPDYTSEVLRLVKTRHVVPTHFDFFETPLEAAGDRIGVPAFVKEVQAVNPVLEVIVPEPLKTMEFASCLSRNEMTA